MLKCKVRAIIELEMDVPDETPPGMPKNDEESYALKLVRNSIAEKFSHDQPQNISIVSVKLTRGMKKKKKEFAHHVPRYHIHVYKVEGKMVEVDWLDADMSPAEVRDIAIELVKRGDHVNPPTKSDCKHIAISFKISE